MASAADLTAEREPELAGNSAAVAVWTLASRVTGLVRVAVIGAVLGPTFLGNLFLAVNQLPNLALQFLGGSLVGSVLVPGLIASIDRGDRPTTERLAGGFLGTTLAGLTCIALLATLAGPLVLAGLTVGVPDPEVAADQRRLGWILMATTMLQLPLYGMALVGGAVMNAHGRFALAAAAPAAENVVIIALMALVALAFGTGTELSAVGLDQLLVLGIGSTLAVAFHAGVMLWGAHRTGVRIRPQPGWRTPAVAELLRRMAAAIGQTSFNAIRVFFMTAVANTVPAGVVAFQVAINLLYFPVQVGGRPIAVVALPLLARLHGAGQAKVFSTEYRRMLGLAAFVTIPAAAAYLALAGPLGRAVSFGELAETGPALVAWCVVGLAPAVVGESMMQLATMAAYARHDTRLPLRASAAGTVISIGCLLLAFAPEDDAVTLLAVGLAFSAGSLLGSFALHHRLCHLLPAPDHDSRRPLLRALGASVVMAGPAYAAASVVSNVLDGAIGGMLAVVVAAATGIAVYVGVQGWWRSRELAFFAGGLRRFRHVG